MEEKHVNGEEQIVVFELAGESYGVEIARVQEIDRMETITAVPQAPHYVRGVQNLRGHVIPVVDLRLRFGLPAADDTPLTRIVVVMVNGSWVGVTVDAVSEVLRIQTDWIEPPSAMVTDSESSFLRGIAKLKGRLIILLDLDKVLDKDFDISQLVKA
jgi:purine-binding chemotaxis protein CheW